MPKKVSAAPTHKVNKDGSVTLYLLIESCTPDGVQYKPYSTHLVPTEPIFTLVTIEKAYVLSLDPIVLSAEGWYVVARKLATASVIAAGAQH